MPLPAPPPGLVPADVLFQISIYQGETREKHATYLVQYVYDSVSGKGFIRLPAQGEPHYSANSTLLWRGPQYEGKWLAATPAWIAAAESALRQARQDALPK
jgi:hypothetical protein